MTSVRFEPTFSADERLQTYTLDLAATGNGNDKYRVIKNYLFT
jgi:hypothetical protein